MTLHAVSKVTALREQFDRSNVQRRRASEPLMRALPLAAVSAETTTATPSPPRVSQEPITQSVPFADLSPVPLHHSTSTELADQEVATIGLDTTTTTADEGVVFSYDELVALRLLFSLFDRYVGRISPMDW